MKGARLSKLIWTALLLDNTGLAIILPVLPKLIERLLHGNVALAASYYGLLIAMSGVILFFVGPIQARLSDHFGRKKMLLASTIGSAMSFGALAAAPTVPLLFLAQALYASTGASQPVASTYIAELSSEEERTARFTTLSSLLISGFILGTFLGGVVGACDLNLAMILASGCSLLSAIIIAIKFKETLDPSTVGDVRKGRLNQLNLVNPINAIGFLFSRRTLADFSFTMLCGDFAFQLFLSTWVLFSTLRFHWSVSQSGASLALEGLLGVLAQTVFLRWALPRLGLRSTLLVALGCEAISLVFYNVIDGSLLAIPVIALQALGAVVKPACSGALSREVTPAEQSMLQGALSSQSALCSVTATLAGTALFSYFTSSAAQVFLPGINMIVGCLTLISAMLVCATPVIQTVLAPNTESAPAEVSVE